MGCKRELFGKEIKKRQSHFYILCRRLMDINGDGLLDHVLRIPGVGIYWKKNITGQAGLLKGIELPQGGTVSLYYAESYGTEDSLSFKYVMSKVVYDDNCEEQHGYHTLTTEYEYEDAYYDRDVKENYGFETVRTYSGVDYNGNISKEMILNLEL